MFLVKKEECMADAIMDLNWHVGVFWFIEIQNTFCLLVVACNDCNEKYSSRIIDGMIACSALIRC
jgi:hypothetical protein